MIYTVERLFVFLDIMLIMLWASNSYCTMNTQQTRNHFWTSLHVSYWFIIGTAPPVCVFMCIHENTRVLLVVTSFERVWHESYWVRTRTYHHMKSSWFHGNTCRHTKFFHRIRWIRVRKHVNWASWTHKFTYRTCEITARCLLGIVQYYDY